MSRPQAATVEQPCELTRETVLDTWYAVIYARSEAEFLDAWQSLVAACGPLQQSIIEHILKEYMPWHEQWLNATLISINASFNV